MLEPESRHLLTDALRPPDGFAVERALATTYTVDLNSVLLAPLAMAAYDQRDAADVDSATPLALLESIRRHAEHTTVLCQAAGIHVPARYPKLAAFAEGCIAEVVPPPGRTFHPKIWLLRFVDLDGRRLHRFACLSRNLTGDRSWDTVLICDEDPDATNDLDPDPISTFVEELLPRTVRPLAPARHEQILDLCQSLRGARLALPEPFTAGRVVPLGTPSGTGWPLPAVADTLAVISPFLDVPTVGRLPQAEGPRIVVSRPDTLERLGARAITGVDARVLQPLADTAQPDDASDTPAATGDLGRGVHAKVFVWEAQGRGHLLTGSANCTGAAFGGNIEMSVHLVGPAAACGVAAVVGDDKSGFLRMTQSHTPSESDPRADPVYEAERRIEAWHAALACAQPRFIVSEGEAGYDMRLTIQPPADPHNLAENTTVRPVGARSTPSRPLAAEPLWRGLSLAGLTPYLAVTTTVEVDGAAVTRDCVLLAEVVNAPEDRLTQLLRELLARQEDILRYLALLLGDPSVDDLLDRLLQDSADGEDDDKTSAGPGLSFDDLVLLEPLVRAAARGDDSLMRAHRLLEDLKNPDGDLPQLSAEFLELWHVVWEGSHS